MRVYEASRRISAEFGGIRDLSRHLSLNCTVVNILCHASTKTFEAYVISYQARVIDKASTCPLMTMFSRIIVSTA